MPQFSIGQCATLACLLEATAPKVGNVHRGADFQDLRFNDFVLSAVAVGPAMEEAVERGVGVTCLAAIRATRAVVATNTNLGIVLLLAPLAAVPRSRPLAVGVQEVLEGLTEMDSQLVYEAIRVANPGGLGDVEAMDVNRGEAPARLRDAMLAAAERDLVARQYIDGYRLVLDDLVEWMVADVARGISLSDAIVHAQVRFLSRELDSLVVRKCGVETAERLRDFARAVMQFGGPGHDEYYQALGDFDFWLRADGHRRNPGTTADLIAAALFVMARDERIATASFST